VLLAFDSSLAGKRSAGICGNPIITLSGLHRANTAIFTTLTLILLNPLPSPVEITEMSLSLVVHASSDNRYSRKVRRVFKHNALPPWAITHDRAST